MIKGFLTGSLALIALYVFVQKSTSAKLSSGSTLIVQGVKRILSSDVAGVPQRKAAPAAAAGTAPSITSTKPGMA